jgi:TolB-like protein
VLARVLERDPDWTVLPATTPPRLRDLLRRCLTKNAGERPRDVGDLRGELLAIASDLSSPGRRADTIGGPPSLAVLYFENLSTEAESEYFCSGITEDLLTDLSKVKGMRVASRRAVTRYRGASADSLRVAAELGVSAVLEGSVRRAGPRVRITVSLVSADGFQIWGERYDRTLEDVFAVQEEIASSIALALQVALTPAETERLGQDRPSDIRAYDLYLKGRELYGRYTPESLHQAIRLFEQAIEVDASYALAYAGIGDAYGQLLQWSDESPEELVRRGLEAARRAITLNPRLPEAHKAEALVLGFAGYREMSEAALRRAIEADPRFTPALGNLAAEWLRGGNLAGAERLIRRSLEVTPDDPHMISWLAFVTGFTNRLDESERLIDRILSLSSERFYVTIAHLWGATLWSLRHEPGRLEQCLREGREAGADPSNLAMLEAYLAMRTDRIDHARQLLAESSDSSQLNFSAIAFGAIAALRAGEIDRAVALMRRRIMVDAAPVLMRLDDLTHPLLDLEAFGPRRSELGLVWPVEAPMIDRTRLRLFREVRIESGRPEGSDILAPQ